MRASGSRPGGGSFAELLRAFRESRSWTQEELGERAGLTAKAVGALERGERTHPYPHTVRSLADALGLGEADRAALVASVPRRDARASATPPVPAGTDPTQRAARPASPAATLPGARRPQALFGREEAVLGIAEAIRAGRHRVITLTGPGGVGKTRLANAVAARVADHFAGGTFFVELADVREPQLVLPAVAAAMGVPELQDDDVVASLVPFLSARHLLLVLDNLEQVLSCAPDIAALVVQCPDLVVLATSRAPLRIRAEQQMPVPPLDVPAAGDSHDAFLRSPAVELFLDRSTAAGSPLELDEADRNAVASICRRLEGLPLALELAAAATRVLTPAALLERLEETAYGVGLRDLPDRQRTMTATLDWSHDLLDDAAQSLLAQLAVFSGGFSLDALLSVTAVGGEGLTAVDALVDQSLVTRLRSPGAQSRFRLLEPVRRYAADRLQASGRAVGTADRHARYFRDQARAARLSLRGPELVPCLDRLDLEHANLRSAFLRLLETGHGDEAAVLVNDLWLYLALRGHAREGISWTQRLRPADLSAESRCAAFTAAAGFHLVTGDIAQTRELAGAALALDRTPDSDDLRADAAILAASGAIFAGDLPAARRVLDETTSDSRATADEWARAHLVIATAQVALQAGDLETTERHLDTAERVSRQLGHAFSLATTLNLRATVTELRDEHAASAAILAEAIQISVDAGISWTLGYALPAVAAVAVRLGEPELGARLFGASASLSATYAVDPGFPAARALADRDLAEARRQLGEARFRTAWDAGRTSSGTEVAELARALTQRGRG